MPKVYFLVCGEQEMLNTVRALRCHYPMQMAHDIRLAAIEKGIEVVLDQDTANLLAKLGHLLEEQQ